MLISNNKDRIKTDLLLFKMMIKAIDSRVIKIIIDSRIMVLIREMDKIISSKEDDLRKICLFVC
jgi:hypothetical protein